MQTLHVCSSRKPYWKIFSSKTLNIRKEFNPFFCFAIYIFSQIWKLPNGWLCLKLPYNALQTLDHWLRHLCLCIVLLAPFLKKLAPKPSPQGPLWPSSKIFWLRHWMGIFCYVFKMLHVYFLIFIGWSSQKVTVQGGRGQEKISDEVMSSSQSLFLIRASAILDLALGNHS